MKCQFEEIFRGREPCAAFNAACLAFVVCKSGTIYEINLSASDKPDLTARISYTPKSIEVQAEQARQVPVLDLMS